MAKRGIIILIVIAVILGLIGYFYLFGYDIQLSPRIGPETSPVSQLEEQVNNENYILAGTEPDIARFFEEEIIVKFNEQANQAIGIEGAEIISSTTPIKIDIPSIDILFNKYSIIEVENLFKNLDEDVKFTIPISQEKILAINNKREELKRIKKIKLRGPIVKAVKEFNENPNVEYAEPNFIPYDDIITNDPHLIDDPDELWGMFRIHAPEAWDITMGEPETLISVIENGVDCDHEDLISNIAEGYDNYCRDNTHGTHVAGTVGAMGNNALGVIGVCPNCKVLSTQRIVPDGIVSVAEDGAKVISNSWYFLGISQSINDAIDYATSLGSVVVASAGNRNVDAYTQFPSASENAISVANFNYLNFKADSSNWGTKIDVAAPGDHILSTVPNDGYSWLSGTSMSTPHVSGVAGLLLSVNPNLNSEQIRQIIKKSATDIINPLGNGEDYTGWDMFSANGWLNAYQTLQNIDFLCEANIKSPTVNYFSNKYLFINPVDFSESKRKFYDARVLVPLNFNAEGIANSPNFDYYTIELGEGENPQIWGAVYQSNQPIINNILANIDLSGRSGKQTILLKVFLTDGTFCEDRVVVQPKVALITSPVKNNLYFPTWTDILNFVTFDGEVILYPGIRGFANHPNLQQWSLLYGIGNNPSDWELIITATEQKQGTGDYNTQIYDDVLTEEWNPEGIPDGEITIKLIVETSDSDIYEDSIVVNYDGTHFPYQEGWSRTYGEWGYATSSPVIYNLDNLGDKEIVAVRNYDGIYVFDSGGNILSGWPINIDDGVDSSPTVGDVTGDSISEIAIKTRNYYNEEKIYLFSLSGSLLPGWPRIHSFSGEKGFTENGARSSVVFSDLDNDGVFEIVYTILGLDNGAMERVFVVDSEGNSINGWPQITDDRIVKNPVVGDVDGDGNKEIVVLTESSAYVFSKNGDVMYNWRVTDRHYTNPILADIDLDGDKEIIATDLNRRAIQIWNYDGTPLTGWPINFEFIPEHNDLLIAEVYQPLVGNIDADPEPEIITTSYLYNRSENGMGYFNLYDFTGIYALNHDGSFVQEWPKIYSLDEVGQIYFPGILVDIDMDNKANYIVGSWWNLDKEINAFDANGNLVEDSNFPLRINHIYYSSPAAGDIDNDGDLEIVYNENAVDHLYVWDLPYNADLLDWPMFQHDPQHTGCYDCSIKIIPVSACQTLNQASTYLLDQDILDHSGTCFEVSANNIIFDCQNNIIGGTGSNSAFSAAETYNNIEIRNCNIENFYNGIKFSDSDLITSSNIEIRDNTLTNNAYGISLDAVSNSEISGNTVRRGKGISITDLGSSSAPYLSVNNIISNNNIDCQGNNDEGIYVWTLKDSSILDNTISSCQIGMVFDSFGPQSKLTTGNLIKANRIINADAVGMILHGNKMNDNNFEENSIARADYAIWISENGPPLDTANRFINNNLCQAGSISVWADDDGGDACNNINMTGSSKWNDDSICFGVSKKNCRPRGGLIPVEKVM